MHRLGVPSGGFVRSAKFFCQKSVAVAMRGPMRWYEAYERGRVVTKKRENYRLAQDGILTEGRKQQILSDVFFAQNGYELNWENPRSFNEKIMWLKLHYQHPLITRCCDKYAVKGYVEEVLGPGYVVPTIGRWSDPDEIDFDALPDAFVLKVNWSSGMNIIVPDKSKLDTTAARKKLRRWLQPEQNSYYQTFNWGYRHMRPVIYAEAYISEIGDESQVYDYKFFCYDGVCKNLFITTDRFTNKTYNWFDRDFHEMPFTYGRVGKTAGGVRKPKHFDDMVACAEKLAQPFPFVRVDFYDVGEQIFVGEMTFYCGGGILAFHPEEWDYKLGEFIHLPQAMHFDAPEGVARRRCAPRGCTSAEIRRLAQEKYFAETLAWPNLTQPVAYSEKILAHALEPIAPDEARALDAGELAAFVRERAGVSFAAPVIGIYDDVDAIDWPALPECFEASSTVGRSGRETLTVHHKKYYDAGLFRAQTAGWLSLRMDSWESLCWAAGAIQPRILIMPLLGSSQHHRFFCLGGEPHLYHAGAGRGALDLDSWSRLPDDEPEMLSLARAMAAGFASCVVDIVADGERLYVSGLDPFPGLFERIDPALDRRLGKMFPPQDPPSVR